MCVSVYVGKSGNVEILNLLTHFGIKLFVQATVSQSNWHHFAAYINWGLCVLYLLTKSSPQPKSQI